MGEKRTRNRISSKITELPAELRVKVDALLLDTSNTYLDMHRETTVQHRD